MFPSTPVNGLAAGDASLRPPSEQPVAGPTSSGTLDHEPDHPANRQSDGNDDQPSSQVSNATLIPDSDSGSELSDVPEPIDLAIAAPPTPAGPIPRRSTKVPPFTAILAHRDKNGLLQMQISCDNQQDRWFWESSVHRDH